MRTAVHLLILWTEKKSSVSWRVLCFFDQMFLIWCCWFFYKIVYLFLCVCVCVCVCVCARTLGQWGQWWSSSWGEDRARVAGLGSIRRPQPWATVPAGTEKNTHSTCPPLQWPSGCPCFLSSFFLTLPFLCSVYTTCLPYSLNGHSVFAQWRTRDYYILDEDVRSTPVASHVVCSFFRRLNVRLQALQQLVD